MFRRRIVIRSRTETSQRITRAALEDDFHHFRVEVASAHGQVSSIEAAAPRRPYTLCAQAAERLQALVGMALTQTAHEVTRITDASEQCTHLFELSGLAIAAAARYAAASIRHRIMRVNDRTRSRLTHDGVTLLKWNVLGTVIQGPPPYAGIDLYHGMARWALTTLSSEEAEAALVLRRATGIAKGRGMKNLDAQVHPHGNCFAQQPVRADQAIRIVGSTLDFATRPADLCAHDEAWLGFDE